jgi:hypothetical protein
VGHVLSTYPQHDNVVLAQGVGALEVIAKALLALPVDRAIDLECKSKLGAIEVDDVTADGLLPAELQPEAAAVAQQLPGGTFGGSGLATKTTGEFALFG